MKLISAALAQDDSEQILKVPKSFLVVYKSGRKISVPIVITDIKKSYSEVGVIQKICNVVNKLKKQSKEK